MTSPVTYRDAASLAALLAKYPDPARRPFAVVDVRDSDRVGGHIPGSLNIPAHQFSLTAENLVEQLRDKDEVIFHCMQSQQRGPRCASEFKREVERVLRNEPRQPKVTILRGGFCNWVSEYRSQADKLIEGFDPKFWNQSTASLW